MASLRISKLSVQKVLTSGQMIRIAERMLEHIDSRLVTHNKITAFLALSLVQNHKMNEKCTVQNLVMLSLFHTIGFYQNQDFTNDYNNHTYEESKYMFSCFYLNFMTPLGKDALCLQYLMDPYNEDLNKYIYQMEYKSIITLCAAIADYIIDNPNKSFPEDVRQLNSNPEMFDPVYVKVFTELNVNNQLINQIHSGKYLDVLRIFNNQIVLDEKSNEMLLKLLVYFLDFKSTHTLNHSINTACYAVSLGERLELAELPLSELYISAILHDIGKIATPGEILESNGKLSPPAMEIMRKHVSFSKKILENIVNDSIVQNVYRHHEKINGTGYPQKLTGDKLTISQRILTVADITSALMDSRSYKERFSKEDTLRIIEDMCNKNEIDSNISDFITKDFDQIQEELKELQKILKVDYSGVIRMYNDYIFNDPEDIISQATDYFEEPEVLEEIQDLEEIL